MNLMERLFSGKRGQKPEPKKESEIYRLNPDLEKYGPGDVSLTGKERMNLEKEGRLTEAEERISKASEAIKEAHLEPIREKGVERLAKELEEAIDKKKSV